MIFHQKLGQVPVKVGKGTGCTEESVKELVNATKKVRALLQTVNTTSFHQNCQKYRDLGTRLQGIILG